MNEPTRMPLPPRPVPSMVQPSGPAQYAPPRERESIIQMSQLERDLAIRPLRQIAAMLYTLTYRDQMEMATLLSKTAGANETPENIAAWLQEWAADEVKPVLETPNE